MLILELWMYGGLLMATLVCAGVYGCGGPTERVGAATVWIAWVLSLLLQTHGSHGPGIWVVLIDIVVLAIFGAVSFKTRRLWTLFAAACQLDAVMSHFAAQLTHFQLYSYVVALGLWGGQGMLACLIAGAVGYRRRLKRTSALKAARSPAAP